MERTQDSELSATRWKHIFSKLYDFRHNPSTFNYDQSSSTMAQDIGAGNAAAALLGFKPGTKQFTDWAGLVANASKNGASPSSVFSAVGLPVDMINSMAGDY